MDGAEQARALESDEDDASSSDDEAEESSDVEEDTPLARSKNARRAAGSEHGAKRARTTARKLEYSEDDDD